MKRGERLATRAAAEVSRTSGNVRLESWWVGAALRQLGDGEQHYGGLQRLESVWGVRHDQKVPGRAFPRDVVGTEPNTAVQDLNGRFARVLMFVELLA